ncbi:OmpA family protein [Pseudomaricurvus sp.]|uniref:OmpA family protein n=1 Tax=Pseudomaricurvus sp. TaxID=2004510 RepID=UPI003F6D6011
MKKMIVMTVVCAVSSMGTLARADSATSPYTELKQGTAFTASAVAGAVLGGPVGMILGALGGAYVGDQLKQADEVTDMSESLATAQAEVERLHQQLAYSQQKSEDLQQLAVEALDLKVLFRTGSDTLTEHGQQRVKELATLLKNHPKLRVRLDGYADPRGTDEYNNVLSHYRAESVKEALIAAGVKERRIEAYSHGSSNSRAKRGDLQAYAAERRVVIDVMMAGDAEGFVMSDVVRGR